MANITETTLEQTALDWFESLGRHIAFGVDISPDGSACERRFPGRTACHNAE
jgi:hypothetical protein